MNAYEEWKIRDRVQWAMGMLSENQAYIKQQNTWKSDYSDAYNRAFRMRPDYTRCLLDQIAARIANEKMKPRGYGFMIWDNEWLDR
jgi:hypothetical protein